MKKITLIIALLISACYSVSAQFDLVKETIVTKPVELLRLEEDRYSSPIGHVSKMLFLEIKKKSEASREILKVLYDETERKVVDTLRISGGSNRLITARQINNISLFHGIHNVDPKLQNKKIDDYENENFVFNYQDLWIKDTKIEKLIFSIAEHYIDKSIDYEIDWTGRYITIGTFVSDYLRSSEADSIITVFDTLTERQLTLVCKECIKPQVAGDHIYYGKKFYYEEGTDAYNWKIFRAPLFDFTKSELLGDYMELQYVSPDEKYILASRYLFGKFTPLFLDVAQKKFSFILGRDYRKFNFFYSAAKRVFAVNREKDIIYLTYPTLFPFNATGSEAIPNRTSKEQDKDFWSNLKSYSE